MLFVVGGNGGNAGAAAVQRECERCGVGTAVVAVPKSIDNDVLLVSGTTTDDKRSLREGPST